MTNTRSTISSLTSNTFRVNNLYLPFTDQVIHDNDFYTLEWSQVDEWYKIVPKATIDMDAVDFMFELWRPGEVNHNATTTASTGVDIWIDNNFATPPPAGQRWNPGVVNLMYGAITIPTQNFTTFYQISARYTVYQSINFNEAFPFNAGGF